MEREGGFDAARFHGSGGCRGMSIKKGGGESASCTIQALRSSIPTAYR